MRVLIIEDDEATVSSIKLTLSAHQIVCDITHSGTDGTQMAKVYSYDLIIVDLMLADINGFEVLLRLRAAKVTTPVLILSGLAGADQKVKGLNFGADDYLIKPFNSGELVARIQAIVRRYHGHSQSIITFDKISINLDSKQVSIDGKALHLTSKEYAILELLAMRKGTVLTKDMFLNHLYGGIDEPELKIVDVFICKLRKKLADATGGKNYVATVWGRGYMLREYFSADSDTDLTTFNEENNKKVPFQINPDNLSTDLNIENDLVDSHSCNNE